MSLPPHGLPRLLTGLRPGSVSRGEHLELHGEPPADVGARELAAELDRAGLIGHGGGGFSAAVKLDAVARAGGRPIVLVNGCEGEPTSEKDHLLLERLPHLVIDGALIAAEALGADEVVIAIERDARTTVRSVGRALGERLESLDQSGLIAQVVHVPVGYVSGQETAVINALNRGPAKPTPASPAARRWSTTPRHSRTSRSSRGTARPGTGPSEPRRARAPG
jgi:NADH:ubiquinone oxidoreductase subunit F (NADH-binding)